MDTRKYHRLLVDADAAQAALHQCSERRRALRSEIRATEQRVSELADAGRALTHGDQRRLDSDRESLAALDELHAQLQATYRSQRALADACRRVVEQRGSNHG